MVIEYNATDHLVDIHENDLSSSTIRMLSSIRLPLSYYEVIIYIFPFLSCILQIVNDGSMFIFEFGGYLIDVCVCYVCVS